MGYVKFVTGEKYEGMYVEIRNVKVGFQSGSGSRHIRGLLDSMGNRIY